jgi:plasmid stability protein
MEPFAMIDSSGWKHYGSKVEPLEARMISLTLKGIPDEMHRLLKERARQNGRSLSAEVMVCLRQAVMPRRIEVDELVARASVLREQAAVYLTEDDLDRIRREGLP